MYIFKGGDRNAAATMRDKIIDANPVSGSKPDNGIWSEQTWEGTTALRGRGWMVRRKQVRLQIITLQSASINADGDVSAIDPSARS